MLSETDRIYYINLDHRHDRNKEIIGELTKMGIPSTKYERFPAIYHKEIGGVGCGRSHIAILEDALKKGYHQIMVLEDDFMFCVTPQKFYDSMENLNQMEYDICLLSYNMIDSKGIENSSNFRKVLNSQTTSGYIIKRHYFQKLINVFKEAVDGFEKTNYHWIYAIDVMWKPLQQIDNWICFIPRLGKQRPSYSDCSNTYSDVDW
jgi:glycosyl transferase, family 25